MDTSNRKNIAILAFTLIVVMLGYGLVIPLYPFYIEKLGASGSELGLLISTSALLELLFGPVWGGISDRVGRKPILLLGVFGYALSSLLFGLSTEVWMLFASRALSGVLSSAVAATALAYISDSTAADERGWGMGMLGAAMGLGIILGPAAGGWLGANSLSLPFFIAAGMSMLALLLGAALLPESLPVAARTLRQAQGKGKVRTVQFGLLWQSLFGPVGLLLFMLFLVSFGLTNFESVFGLYAAQELGYGPERVGTILAVVGLTSTLGKAILIGPLTRHWGEAPIIKVSLAASSAAFIVLLLAKTYPGVLAATGVFILSKTLLRTVIMSLTSKRTTLGQGTAMGLCNSFMNLGRVVGPIWAGFIFDVNVTYPYLSGAVIMAIGFVISLVWIAQPRSEPSPALV
ncbi:MAG TPA: MFS transporter [Anaerolineae bacterium]|nr:MFS transporter [Anaerolineae bacterium]HQI83477.1 MFS transporter [Anaerolineae bacterium]